MFLDKETFGAHGSFNTFYSEEWLCIQQLCTPALVNLFTLTQFREPSKKKCNVLVYSCFCHTDYIQHPLLTLGIYHF